MQVQCRVCLWISYFSNDFGNKQRACCHCSHSEVLGVSKNCINKRRKKAWIYTIITQPINYLLVWLHIKLSKKYSLARRWTWTVCAYILEDNIQFNQWFSLTEADNGWNLAEFGVANSLRNGETGDGECGKDVVLKRFQTVFRKPSQDGNEILETLPDLPKWFLICECLERVVGEKGLLEVGFEGGAEASRSCEADWAACFRRGIHETGRVSSDKRS